MGVRNRQLLLDAQLLTDCCLIMPMVAAGSCSVFFVFWCLSYWKNSNNNSASYEC